MTDTTATSIPMSVLPCERAARSQPRIRPVASLAMKTRTLLLLSVGTALMILLAGGALLFQLSSQETTSALARDRAGDDCWRRRGDQH